MSTVRLTLKQRVEQMSAFNAELLVAATNGIYNGTVIDSQHLSLTPQGAVGLLFLDNYAHHFGTLLSGKMPMAAKPVPRKVAYRISNNIRDVLKTYSRQVYEMLYPEAKTEPHMKWEGKPWVSNGIRTELACKEVGLATVRTLLPVVYGNTNTLESQLLKPGLDFVMQTLSSNFPETEMPVFDATATPLRMDSVHEWANNLICSGERNPNENIPASYGHLNAFFKRTAIKAVEDGEKFFMVTKGTVFHKSGYIFYTVNDTKTDTESLEDNVVCLG